MGTHCYLKFLEEMTPEYISDIADKLKKGITIKDRRSYFKVYPSCFVGQEAVQWLLKNAPSKTKEEALFLGQKLMDEGIFCHFSEDHQFQDAKLFYKFNTPEVAAIQKSERQVFAKTGIVERKTFFSWSSSWVELKGNILMYYSEPQGALKGKLNLLGCKIASSPSSSNAFEIITSKGSVTFKCESEQVKNSWVSVICRAKDRTLEERKKLLEEWNKEGECISCIAALASEQAEQEEQDDSTLETSEAPKETNETISEMLNLPLANTEEKLMIMKDTFKKEIIVLALLRHFG